jgi:hypothetical protein
MGVVASVELEESLIKNIAAGVAVVVLALAGPANASVIGNGPPNQTGGSDLNSFLEADNFTLGSATNIVLVQYWTLQDDLTDYAGTTDWGFYQDAVGIPGTLVASGNTVATGAATGNTTFGLNEFEYTFAVNVPLLAGNYWLALHNGPSSTLPSTTYYWAWSADSGNSQSLDLSASPAWVGNSSELAFQLSSPVPEPASIGLCGGALLAAWLARRRTSVKA